jgi:hypothetical protein
MLYLVDRFVHRPTEKPKSLDSILKSRWIACGELPDRSQAVAKLPME